MKRDYDKIKNFDMTLEECRLILEAIGGLIIVDDNGYVKFFSKDIMEVIERINAKELPDTLTDKHIREIHPTSKINKLMSESFDDRIATYNISGQLNITRILPVMRDGKRIAIVDLDLFRNNWEISQFLHDIGNMETKHDLKLPKNDKEMETQLKTTRYRKYTVADLKGDSYLIQNLKNEIYKLAESSSTVLITGETGTGKEIVAHSIHAIGGRQMHPFLEVNCAAIPESLFESELFGYEEASFTGAARGGKAGVFERANHGTIFFDEVDQIPYNMQPKLLRVLQENEFTRIGGKKVHVDVRIIAASNKDLKAMVLNKQFREDLYYRLNVINIKTPALREHKEDIELLVNSRIDTLNQAMGRNIRGISEEALSLLQQYEWPGNIRELFNVTERAMNMCEGNLLDVSNFKDIFYEVQKKETVQNSVGFSALDEIMRITERESIVKALKLCGNNKTRAAEILGISRTALHHKIKKYNL